jgi:Xaa-Pro aminopeptidase
MTTTERESTPETERTEHQARQRRAAEAARELGLDGLVVWSQRTWHGDVTYLTAHEASFPQLPDSTEWSDKSASALVLPVEGEPVLLVDAPFSPESLHVDDVRTELRVAAGVAQALRDCGIAHGRLGLVGSTVFRRSSAQELERALGHRPDLVEADAILERLRVVKSPAEIRRLRHAAAVGVGWMTTMLEAVEPGKTEGDVVGAGLAFLAAQGGYASDVIVASGQPARPKARGVPSWDARRRLETGDLVRMDAFGPVNGYFTDFSRSTVIGRRPSSAQRRVLEASIELVETIAGAMRPGVTLGRLHDLGTAWLSSNGFPPHGHFEGFWPAFGHSLGLGTERPFVVAGAPETLEPNMVFTIEIVVGTPEVGGAGFEQMLLVVDEGVEVLSAACPSRWWN